MVFGAFTLFCVVDWLTIFDCQLFQTNEVLASFLIKVFNYQIVGYHLFFRFLTNLRRSIVVYSTIVKRRKVIS